jgi:3-methyladenine DNA glycosylase/8-oxoguanine DNA glycosylase
MTLELDAPLDLAGSLGPLVRGHGDRTIRLARDRAWWATRTHAGAATVVTGTEAHRAWHGLVRHYGEQAPGPSELGLRLLPSPATLARLPYWAFHPLGLERRRADLIRAISRDAGTIERLADGPIEVAYARLRAIPGIGPWTAAEVGVRALGDVDAVSVGDFHLPHLVAYALAGEPRATDARMLELLEPYRGRRALVVRLLELSGARAPRYGPRLAPRRIEGI